MNRSPIVSSFDDESSSTSEVLLEQHDNSDILRTTHQDTVLQQDAAPIIPTQEAMLRQDFGTYCGYRCGCHLEQTTPAFK
jgi:hypothetical protein